MKKITLLCISLLLVACKSNSIYYWDSYPQTSYAYKHEPSDETFQKHFDTLTEIINNAESKNKKIPPGIYIELAMMYSSIDDLDKAKEMLNKEKELFPESAKFIQVVNNRLIGAQL